MKRARLLPIVGLVFLGLLSADRATSELEVGVSLYTYSGMGLLSSFMKVLGQYGDDNWIFRKYTTNVFRNVSTQPAQTLRPVQEFGEQEFSLAFCDNAEQFFSAYFRRFSIESLDLPFRAFSAVWEREVWDGQMGIDSGFVGDEFGYILVRLDRHRSTRRMTPVRAGEADLLEEMEEDISWVRPGNESSVRDFMNKHGSHYICSYTTGDSLYQVFVYKQPIYKRIKERFSLESVKSLLLAEIAAYFTPAYVVHHGKILSASGNTTVDFIAGRKLRSSFFNYSYPNLVNILENPALRRTVDGLLGNQALLQLDLRSLEVVFADKARRQWFRVVQDNDLNLWEVNA